MLSRGEYTRLESGENDGVCCGSTLTIATLIEKHKKRTINR